MAVDRKIMVRLQASAEDFSTKVNQTLREFKTNAEQAGVAAGQAMARGLGGDEVTRSTALATQGVDRYAQTLSRADPIIARFAADQAAAKREIDASRVALKTGEITLEEYNQAVLRARTSLVESRTAYNQVTAELRGLSAAHDQARSSMGAVTASAGQQRAGMQQLSFQIGDAATMFALGAKPMQIFASQGMQVVQAMSLMQGTAGGLIGFLSGPWGAVLLGAGTVVGMLVSNLDDASEAAQRVEFSSYGLSDAQGILGNVIDLTTGKINTQSQALLALARAQAIAGKIEAESRAAKARATISDSTEKQWVNRSSIMGFNFERQMPIEGQVGKQMLAGVVSPEQAIERLDVLRERGRITTETYSEMASAIANLAVEAANVKVFEDLERALDGDTVAIQGFLKETERATRATREKRERLTEAQKAFNDAKREADQFIASLNREVQSIGLTAAQLRQLEVERAKDAAATQEQRDKIEELNVAREDALSNEARAKAADRAAQASADFQANVIGPLEREIRLLGMIGPAREYAALALEEEAFKAEMAAKGIEDVNAAWEAYAGRQRSLIDYEAGQQQIENLADLYRDLFSDGVDGIWDRFKDAGKEALAIVAAQFTLAALSGQGGPFHVQGALGAAMGRSPLGSIFGGMGGFGRSPANDNGFPMPSRAGGFPGGTPPINGDPGHWTVPMGGGPMPLPGAAAKRSLLDQAGVTLGGAALGNMIGGGGGATGQIGSMIGAFGGQALGSGIAALGAFGGPIGAIAGGLVGTLLGGALSSTKRGSAIIGGGANGQLGISGFYGNSSGRKDAAAGSASSLIDSIYQIADALGADVDASKGKVSVGMRNGEWFVDPQGRGYTKASKFRDIRGFGQDEGAAREAAISDLLADGVLKGISAASQRILQNRGGDLEAAIEKALLIESVPKLLRERLDPLGAALDTVYDKFKQLADALREGGASAEQIADARQLWELEKADAIAAIGEASGQLKDYLASLNVGSNSPLSLRRQRAEAETRFAGFEDQVEAARAARDEVERLRGAGAGASEIDAAERAARAAAGKIDQQGLTGSSQQLLDILRQSEASGGGYFAGFDRVRALLGDSISLVDSAAARGTTERDPFVQETAINTGPDGVLAIRLASIEGHLARLAQQSTLEPRQHYPSFVSEPRAYAAR
jgi:hypothetical protein